MARDGVAVDPMLAAAVASRSRGEAMNVRAVCRSLGVSPKTFYKYLARFDARGVPGLFPDSRRPRTFPTLTSAEVEDVIVAARKDLDDAGLDDGAESIAFWISDHPGSWPADARVPSRATINRILVRRGLRRRVPTRAPTSHRRRFEAEKPNTRWQMDGFEVVLADGRTVVVLHIIDDCSRLDLACHVARSENGDDVCRAFTAAVSAYGLPAELLTDNGTAFSGHRRGWSSQLDTQTQALGVRHVTSSVHHPQTCGKVERAHQTVRRWLAKHPTPATIPDLQALLDDYRVIYNEHRRKTHLGGLTPSQRFALGPLDHPTGTVTAPVLVTTPTVSDRGSIGVDGHELGLGRAHTGKTTTVFRQGNQLTVFLDRTPIQFTLDRTRRYQPQPALPLPKS